jgi:hypothetical protein
MDGRFVSYLRVSTDKQGKSGLGLEAQRESVDAYLNGGNWSLIAEYVEVESGKNDARPQLAKALAHCKLTSATLIVAKLDRLSRNQSFLMRVYEGTGDGGVVFCDLPTIPAGPVGKVHRSADGGSSRASTTAGFVRYRCQEVTLYDDSIEN